MPADEANDAHLSRTQVGQHMQRDLVGQVVHHHPFTAALLSHIAALVPPPQRGAIHRAPALHLAVVLLLNKKEKQK
jgi:hypothetical protein